MSGSQRRLACALLVSFLALPGGAADAEPEGYRLLLPAKVELVAGKPGELSMSLIPAGGYRIDRKAPLRVHLSAAEGSGLSFEERLDRKDVADERSSAPRFAIALEGARAGVFELRIRTCFWLCRKQICWPERAERKLQVEVAAPPPPAESEARDDST